MVMNMDLSPSPVGLFVMSAGVCVFGTCLGYITFGRDYGRPWLPSVVGGLG